MDKFPICWKEKAVGELMVEQDSLYTCFAARACLPEDGLWSASGSSGTGGAGRRDPPPVFRPDGFASWKTYAGRNASGSNRSFMGAGFEAGGAVSYQAVERIPFGTERSSGKTVGERLSDCDSV